ncbi:hypothetical protein M0811_06204 [Anaeramoeba ignava]|uniref:Uncharacterized protein n=1 Tax=Anaeramoeba ignava TaxID=1746090 RepID=A0A9Q0LQC5_ANAIG|nr:hypothetical protein M0811_06204 [Anaeramoeba ignava]
MISNLHCYDFNIFLNINPIIGSKFYIIHYFSIFVKAIYLNYCFLNHKKSLYPPIHESLEKRNIGNGRNLNSFCLSLFLHLDFQQFKNKTKFIKQPSKFYFFGNRL